jgi:hypothetical protein
MISRKYQRHPAMITLFFSGREKIIEKKTAQYIARYRATNK